MRRNSGIALLAIAVLAPVQASAGEPASPDPIAGLLDASADVRASSARGIGVADLVAAAPAIPVLVEALDDESPAVAKAAEEAIVALGSRAAPVVLRQLTEVPVVDGDGGMGDLVVALGSAFEDEMVAVGLTGGTATDRRVAWIAAGIVFSGGSDREWAFKSRLRMLAVETTAVAAAEKGPAAAATALIAYRIAWTRAQSKGGGMAALSLAAGLSSLTSLTADPKARDKAALAARFMAVTGVGDVATVAALTAGLLPGRKGLPGGPAVGPDGLPREGTTPLTVPKTSESSIAALARLSLAFPEATAALDSLSDDVLDSYSNAIANSGGASYLARRALASSSEARVGWAAAAIREGVRKAELVPILVEGAIRDASGFEGRYVQDAALALARLGPTAVGAIEPLQKRFAEAGPDRATRVRVCGALLGIQPGHRGAQDLLLEEGSSVRKPADSGRGSPVPGPIDAILALAVAGEGREVARCLEKSLIPPAEVRESPWALGEYAKNEACARGLGRLASVAGPEGLRALVGLLDATLPGDGTEPTAEVVARSGFESGTPFRLRSAALRSIGAYGPAARDRSERLKALLASPDPRLRYLAAQALRRIDAANPPK